MKVIVNIDRSLLPEIEEEWHPCEGLKFRECDDGSFSLIVTTDLDAARKADRDAAEVLDRIKGDR